MIVFLYGNNSYSRTRKLIEVLSVYRERLGGREPARFDFENGAEAADLSGFLNAPSMFAEKRFAVVENPFESKEKKELKKLLEANIADKDSIIIIVSSEEPPKSFAFLLEKPAVSQAFPEIKKGADLDSFIRKEAASRGFALSPEDIGHLSEAFGGDLWAIATELDRLALMEKKAVTKTAPHDFFKTISAFKFGHDPKQKILALETLLSSRGDDAARIFNTLSFGLSDGQKISRLADYDVAIKSGKLDYEEALLDFALLH